MKDFLKKHGFKPIKWFQDPTSEYSVGGADTEIVVGLNKDTWELEYVYLIVSEDAIHDPEYTAIRVPNCDNKLALYTLLHNFDLLPK